MSSSETFKAQTAEQRSEDILVSFASKWRMPLLNNAINCVFRRKYPKTFAPNRLLIYLAAPQSEIVGYFEIKDLRSIKIDEALALRSVSGVSDQELKDYYQGYEETGCYTVRKAKIYDSPIKLALLRSEWGFYPPQSFVSLSISASAWVDRVSEGNAKNIDPLGKNLPSKGLKG